MNASTSPDDAGARAQPNGTTPQRQEQREQHTKDVKQQERERDGEVPDAESEAETLIDSPVKKKEAEKQQQQQKEQAAVRSEPAPHRSRIGGLLVPGDDDDDVDSAESPMVSTEDATSAHKNEDAEMADEFDGSDRDAEGSDSEDLSSPQSDEDAEGEEDEEMVRSDREGGDANGAESPNPRKRKHRASSASLPNSKRRSMDPPKRRLRGMHSEADAPGIDRSTSPKPHSHRRAASTASALDNAAEGVVARKRKSHFPVKEPKSASGRSGWEESDASSETASRGHADEFLKRSSRGIGRSTSTPGRPGGREHKRHVNKYGFTKLAEACEEGKLDLVKELREKDPDSLELAEFAGNKPLQIASLNGNAEVVQYLIEQGCQIDCANVDKDTPLIDAAENGHVEVVKLLLDAGVDPLSQNLKGQQALDVVTDDTDDGPTIRAALHNAIETWNSSSARHKRAVEEEIRHGTGPSKELHFMARTYENMLRLVANNNRNGVREFLAARVPVDNAAIATAAKTGDVYLVNMLLAEMTEKKASQRAEKPMLAVLGSSHWEMVQALTELETFNPMWRDRQGRNWPTLAEERAGPNWKQERELLQKLYDQQASNLSRRSSSPISRRDGGGKRFLRRPDNRGDGSDDDVSSPDLRRKNGRRLMSRKDMRAASSKALSEGSSDAEGDADAEGEVDEDVVMEDDGGIAPPDTPSMLHASGRTRSKSTASQNSDVSPRTRRRSASHRDPGAAADKPPLPAVKEAPEEADIKTEEQQKAEEAKAAVEEAQRLAAKQKEEAEAEAEAKRVQEEAEAARLRAEEERRAAEARRQREAEAAEEARQRAAAAEEERQRQLVRDEEARQQREQRRREVLAALPPSLRHVLMPGSEFTYEGLEEKAYLVQHFTPLRVSRREVDGEEAGEEWVLSLQAAPLMGKEAGLAMLMGEEFGPVALGDLEAEGGEARRVMEDVIAAFPTTAKADDDHVEGREDDFEAELARTAERLNVLARLRGMFFSPPPPPVVADGDAPSSTTTAPVRMGLVKLRDVRQRLHPLLRDLNLEVQYPPAPAPQPTPAVVDKTSAIDGGSGKDGGGGDAFDLFAGMRKVLEAQQRQQLLQEGGLGKATVDAPVVVGWTDVRVVHEK